MENKFFFSFNSFSKYITKFSSRFFTLKEYFEKFNDCLHCTDILWTKPSELVFYTALGLPIIMTRPLGAHEYYNERWINQIGGGFTQLDPRYADEWLFDWVNDGILAEAAWEGFMEAPKFGVYEIEKILFTEKFIK